jgi:hypothetical protein
MSLGLTYNDDLSRVQIAITDLPSGVETVTVERSVNELLWETVRGAAALPVSGGTASVDDFEFAADVANYYRVTSDAPAGLYLPGTAGAYASTPDHASLKPTDGIDLRADVTPADWSPSGTQYVLAKYHTSANRSYAMRLSSTGRLNFIGSTDGTTTLSQDSSVSLTEGGRLGIRARFTANNGAGGKDFRFYTGTAPSISTPLGTSPITTATAVTLFAGTAALTVGARDDGGADRFAGVVHSAEVQTLAGVSVANPDFTVHPTGTASFTDAAGRLWTVHGGAVILGDPVYTGSITPSLGGRVWLKSIRHPFLNRPVSVGGVTGDTRSSKGALLQIQGRSAPIAVTDVRGSQHFQITLRTATLVEARDMDLTLASGDTFYLQVPAGSQIPGGYVAIDTTGLERFGPVSTRRRWPLACTVVVPPGPGVVGTTLTWGGVFNLYGSWAALDASNPTWRDLLATVGSPDDLVVL